VVGSPDISSNYWRPSEVQTDCLIHKYVRDTTLTEIIHSRNDPSNMQNFFHQLLSWSNNNDLSVNFSKTKDGSISRDSHVHVEAVTSRVTRRLYFLKQLKRAGVSCTTVTLLYLAVIRPVLEYAAPVLHHSLNKSQTSQIESIQTRKPCCRKETARYRSCSFRFKDRRHHSLQV